MDNYVAICAYQECFAFLTIWDNEELVRNYPDEHPQCPACGTKVVFCNVDANSTLLDRALAAAEARFNAYLEDRQDGKVYTQTSLFKREP